MPLRVVLADDHSLILDALRALLEREGIEVVGQCRDGQEAVHLTNTLQPDVVVLDLFMPILNGLDAGREILRLRPRMGIVLLTVCCEQYQILAALRAGIRGYVVKTQAAEELIAAIQTVAAGETYLSGIVSQLAITAYPANGDHSRDPLTRRERQVLQLVVEGRKTKEIADLLSVTVKTAESYRANVMAKLRTHDTAGLVRYAVRRGVIEAVVAWCALL